MEQTKFRMKVVDEHESIREIEETLKSGIIEVQILHAHNLVKLVRILKEWQPWNRRSEHKDPGSDTDIDLQAIFHSPDLPKSSPQSKSKP